MRPPMTVSSLPMSVPFRCDAEYEECSDELDYEDEEGAHEWESLFRGPVCMVKGNKSFLFFGASLFARKKRAKYVPFARGEADIGSQISTNPPTLLSRLPPQW